jgi:hypothetical protein
VTGDRSERLALDLGLLLGWGVSAPASGLVMMIWRMAMGNTTFGPFVHRMAPLEHL